MRDICTIDADGSGFVNLTEEPGVDTYEREGDWSPDGSQIVFLSEGRMSMMDADGSNVQRLDVERYCCGEPDW